MPLRKPLALCAVGTDHLAAAAVAVARQLRDDGAYDVRYVHFAAGPEDFGLLSRLPGGRRSAAHEDGRRLFARLRIPDEESEVIFGDPVVELAALAEERDAALIVLGSRGDGPLAGALTGSVTRALSQWGRWPLLIAGPRCDGRAAQGEVICAVSSPNDEAVAVALTAERFAERVDRPLLIAGTSPAEHDAAITARDMVHRAVTCRLERTVPAKSVGLSGELGEALLDLASSRDVHTLAIGSRSAGAVREALEGSVARDVLRQARQPVLVVPVGADR